MDTVSRQTENRTTSYEQRFYQPPFDLLLDEQRAAVIRSASLSWFRPGEKLIRAGSKPESLMIVQRGVIEERSATDKQKIYAHYAEDDLFDAPALLNGGAKHEYICLEEALIQEIPSGLFLDICKQNSLFEGALQANLGEKYQRLDSESRPAMADFLLSRIERHHCTPAKTLSCYTPLSDAVRILEEEHLEALLVDLEESSVDAHPNARLGIVTRTDLLRAVAIEQLPLETRIGRVAVAPLVKISIGEYLFDALLVMTQRRIERVAVFMEDELVGFLDLTRILALASNHSHLLAMRIARASHIAELIHLSPEIEQQARSLFSNGVRTGFVMKLVSTLNDQLLKRLFELHFPEELHNQIALLSLGSEGRGEQVIKTDQDNALIVADGCVLPPQSLLESFTELLIACGWPRCKGEVMVCNPHWVITQSQWQQRIIGWIDNASPEHMMEMAMMVDARTVAGNTRLLDEFREGLHKTLGHRESFLATFVAPALQFDTRLTFFGRIKEGKDHRMDIKKAGIFPLVHGVRTLALEGRISELSTIERVAALKENGQIDADLASRLEEAFLVLNRLRLEQQVAGICDGNELDLEKLDYRRRDMLRHCLHTVKKFHQYLQHHFHLGG
ncbi:DUF294 nucleotidyltransferase-like domain-containing protein [Parendozoicomonas sp. Alg238-R29]|uniref:DUF294 nucleotidyltransferase-like domain-containing protein n=1 Tax=Parendozoicomonas sp. Alg238-R29 TaxID=2993446 RepID=UPI00248D4867|nr:DUF294 nucleotidyltransferase-like domain-containing protein [Parendozoicomonas sp. Alg238-R29]